jgi:hypothetical protein
MKKLTVEQIQAMNNEEIYNNWALGVWPFEFAKCHPACITMHATSFCDCILTKAVLALPGSADLRKDVVSFIRRNAADLIRLREQYADHYATPDVQD